MEMMIGDFWPKVKLGQKIKEIDQKSIVMKIHQIYGSIIKHGMYGKFFQNEDDHGPKSQWKWAKSQY